MQIQDSFWHDFVTTLAFFILIDSFWFAYTGKQFYHDAVRKIQKTPMRPRLWSALLLYPLLAFGQAYFVLPEARKQDSVLVAIHRSFLLAVIIYGSIESVNHAIFTNWTLELSAIDMFFGILLNVIVSALTFEVHHHVPRKTR